jgi:ligand-binding sensor domain-containing protein
MRCTFFCYLLAVSILTHAQPKTLSVDHLTVENGLPENFATAIVQDAKGYIWIGTQLGLVRYDGYGMKVYKEELDKVKSGFYGAYALFIDSRKRLWVGTALQGLLKYDPIKDAFTTYPLSSNNETLGSVVKILEDAKGNIWLGATNIKKRTYVLYKFDEATTQFTSFGSDKKNGVPATQLFKAIADIAGNIWAATNNGIYKFNPTANKFTGYLTSTDTGNQKIFSNIYEAPSEPGVLYLSTGLLTGCQGMVRFNTKNNTATTFRHSNADVKSIVSDTVRTFQEDNARRLWIGTAAGLSRFNRATGNFTSFTPHDRYLGMGANSINIIQDDVSGFLWLSSGKGLLSFNPANGEFTRYISEINRDDALPTNAILRVFRDSTGGIWLTTRNYGAQRINIARSRFTLVKNIPDQPGSYNSGMVYNIAQDIDHTFWMFTAKGLCHYHPIKNLFKNIKLFNEANDPNVIRPAMIQAKNGLIWANHADKGIVCYDPPSGRIKNYSLIKNDTTSLSDTVIRRIYEDHNGTIWIGTRTGGICRFNKAQGNFARYPFIINSNRPYSGKSLDDQSVLSMFEDSQEDFGWVLTREV